MHFEGRNPAVLSLWVTRERAAIGGPLGGFLGMGINSLYRGTASAVSCVAFMSAIGLFDQSAEAALTASLSGYAAGRYEQCGFNSGYSWNSTGSMTLWSVRAQQHIFTESSGNQTLTWCTEVYQGVNLGNTYTFNVTAAENAPSSPVAPGPMGAAKGGVVRDLFARWINATTGYVNGSTSDRDAKSAAFQVVLWEITHENFTATTSQGILGQLSLSTGAFRANLTGASASWYSQIVASLGVGGFQNSDIYGLTNDLAQDQLAIAVPGPGAIALLGLAGLANRRRR
jgi:hypothetical protein